MKSLIAFVFFSFTVLGSYSQSTFPYQLDKPTIKRDLPEILNEISGLTDIDAAHVACVQDELGIIFIYNFRKGEIVSQHRFDSVGDFEGLTYFNHTLFVLRSDGRLTEWPNFPSDDDALKQTMLPLLTSDNEGLCSDPAHHRILIAAKSKPSDRKEKSERYIYGYDLTSNQLQEKPLYSLNLQALEENARRFNIEQTETNAKGKVKPFNFRPASLAVHPVSDEIYIISAADKLLVVINRKGEVTFMKSLHPETFAKAEGITFLDDGTLIITNEAAGKMATLYVFEMI